MEFEIDNENWSQTLLHAQGYRLGACIRRILTRDCLSSCIFTEEPSKIL
jgi:hypothetical protein